MLLDKKALKITFFLLWFIFFLVLSYFRDSLVDENIYIGESITISNLLSNGEWIGNYGVGLHGFLSKLIVGLIFIFTGPNVFIPTILNIIFAILSGVILFNILIKNFYFKDSYAYLGIILFFSSYQFVLYTPTFYRDTGSLLCTLLILESILNKRNNWLSGFYLLLLLDAKEHVFFTLAPAILIWTIVSEFIEKGKILKEKIFSILKRNIQYFLPSLIFLILMFTTGIIPLNIYNASILSLADGGLTAMSKGFELRVATYNQDVQFNREAARMIPLLEVPEKASFIVNFFVSFINIILSYIGKIFYPRTFSFISVPFLIILPSIFLSWKYLKDWVNKLEKEKILLPILLLFYLFIYILRASLGRYLFPILPIFIIFFLLFLKDVQKSKFFFKIVLLTATFSLIGLYFEYSYVAVKIMLMVFLLILIFLLYYSSERVKRKVKYILVFAISLFSLGSALLSSYNNGQIGASLKYGYNRECEKIISLVENEDRIWINEIGWDRLPFILRGEDVQSPEWKWNLREWVPKNALLKDSNSLRTYNFSSKNIDQFEKYILSNEIQKVIYVDLGEIFARETYEEASIQDIMQLDILILEKEVSLKNKKVYIFKVIK